MHIEIQSITNKGGRSHNEDYCDFSSSGKKKLLALADGLGGHQGGEIASKTAVAAALKTLEHGDLDDAFKAAQDAVLDAQKEKHLSDMHTTLVLAVIDENRMHFGHIGDSRLYLFDNGKIIFVTEDHSVVNVLLKTGEIKDSQVRNHPDRNKLLRALGNEGPVKAEVNKEEIELEPGDAVLLCTDGFWEYIIEKDMERLLRKAEDPKRWIELMEKKILRRASKGHDNYSAIAVMVN